MTIKQQLEERAKRGESVEGLDLSDANLSGANLSGANLSGADLRFANLSGANLCRANLYRTDLSDANLSDADLRRANLSDADLRRANLSHADLRRANLRFVNLSDADLRFANLSDADLYRIDLSGADLRDTTLCWVSHRLLSKILVRAAGTDTARGEFAAYIQVRPSLCWDDWLEKYAGDPRLEWALRELAKWHKPGDNAPGCVLKWLKTEDDGAAGEWLEWPKRRQRHE